MPRTYNEHACRRLRQQLNILMLHIIYLYYIYIVHMNFQSKFNRQLLFCLDSSDLVAMASKLGKYLPAPGG